MSQPWYMSLLNHALAKPLAKETGATSRVGPGVQSVRRCARSAAGVLLGGALLLGGPGAWALGLGEIDLSSSLNERLDADIELYDAQGLQATEVLVSLASADDFERVGVERFFFLTDLRFEVDVADGSVRGISVTSGQPITEPYLNFLVEVLWPNGRLLKEYTLLLDPPTFSPAAAPAVAAPDRAVAQDGGAGRVQRSPASTAQRTGTRVQMTGGDRAGGPSPLDEGIVDGEFRMTDRNDTLWKIAQRTLPSADVTVKQNMLAIQRLNPDAFLNDNINLLKAGYRLKLPDEQDARSVTEADAERLVAMQNEDWRALRDGRTPSAQSQVAASGSAPVPADDEAAPLQAQIDATPAGRQAPAAAADGDGELRIVAGAGDSVTGAESVAGEQAAAGELTAAMEERDRLSREVSDLTEELDRERELASNQIAVKDRQLEVRDQQIAEMQAQMERMRAELEQRQASAPQSQNQNASASQPWWQSPLALGGAVGVVVLLLVYALIAARRRRAEADQFQAEFDEQPAFAAAAEAEASAAESGATAEASEAAEVAGDDDDTRTLEFDIASADDGAAAEKAADEADQGAADQTVAADDAAPAEGAETGDVIGEADIYIAYGRYPQAIGLLLGVLEEAPERNDVRLKLLELYAETRDREAFDEHMAELNARCSDDDALRTARELAGQFGGSVGEEPVSLDDLSGDDATGPAISALDSDVAAAAQEETVLAEVSDIDSAEPAPAALESGADDSEFELELDDVADSTATQGNDLGGDLGIDFDPDRIDANGSADDLAEVSDAADALDLDLDDSFAEQLDDALSSAVDGGTDEGAAAEPAKAGLTGDLETDGLDIDIDLEDMDALGDDAFDFDDDDGDTASTKLDLARAYIDMGDQDGARDILNEVVAEGSSEQQQRAQTMLEEL